MKKLIATSIIALASSAHAGKIELTSECYPFTELSAAIKSKFDERVILEGVSDRNAKMIVFVNPKTKTYTIVLYDRSSKEGCVIDNGEGIAVPGGKNV
jgi:hypothetical protein